MRKGLLGISAIAAVGLHTAAVATDSAKSPSAHPASNRTVMTVPTLAPELRMPVFKARKSCIRETGSRLKSREADGCRRGLAGEEISGKELSRTNWKRLN